MSLNYLATRFTCTWPWSIAVMLCDGRIVCGCADPYAKRVLGDFRTTSLDRHLARADGAASCAQDLNTGGSSFCGDCPLKLPLADRQAAPVRDLERRAAAEPAVHRVHGGLQHLVLPGVLRAGNRHHAHAPGRHARLGRVHAGRRRSRAVARPHRLLQLRRSVPAQARRRDVRVHQDASFRTSISTPAPTAWR